jgi:excinuclease UvrABC nuclease subunit
MPVLGLLRSALRRYYFAQFPRAGFFFSVKLQEGIQTHLLPQVVCGIYFLLDTYPDGDEVVYVGQSLDIHKRIRSHLSEDVKDFNLFAFIEVEDPQLLNEMEERFILKYLPKYNKRLPDGSVIPGR